MNDAAGTAISFRPCSPPPRPSLCSSSPWSPPPPPPSSSSHAFGSIMTQQWPDVGGLVLDGPMPPLHYIWAKRHSRLWPLVRPLQRLVLRAPMYNFDVWPHLRQFGGPLLILYRRQSATLQDEALPALVLAHRLPRLPAAVGEPNLTKPECRAAFQHYLASLRLKKKKNKEEEEEEGGWWWWWGGGRRHETGRTKTPSAHGVDTRESNVC